jgi:hypothetical protein
MDILQNKPVSFYLTDRDICLLHHSLLEVAGVAIRNAPPMEAYAWAKLAIQMDVLLHNEELCKSSARGEPCYLEQHKRDFAKLFKEYINEEIRPYNQTK